jgi:hypothetical protein
VVRVGGGGEREEQQEGDRGCEDDGRSAASGGHWRRGMAGRGGVYSVLLLLFSFCPVLEEREKDQGRAEVFLGKDTTHCRLLGDCAILCFFEKI